MWYDSTMIITFGNVTNSGTSKIKAIKDGKQVEFAKRTNLQIDKNHINGVTTRGKIVMTPHGFINDDDKEIKAYKNQMAVLEKSYAELELKLNSLVSPINTTTNSTPVNSSNTQSLP